MLDLQVFYFIGLLVCLVVSSMVIMDSDRDITTEDYIIFGIFAITSWLGLTLILLMISMANREDEDV
jgi:hypothetical protein